MLNFFLRKTESLAPGTPVNRVTAFSPARWDGVVVADLGDEVVVEWPRLGPVREAKRQLTAIQH